MRRAIGWTSRALIVLACVAYQFLAHSSVLSPQAGPMRIVLIWLPLVLLGIWVMLRTDNKGWWLVALLAMGAFVYWLEHGERLGIAAASGLSHAAAYLFLLWVFARTLARGAEPIITRFARRIHGALQPEMEWFTRKLTIAWCAFFAAQVIASALLYGIAPLETWSLFVNVLNLPLLALMFAGQYVYRRARHPDCPRASVWQAVEAFTNDASPSGNAEVR